MSDCRYLARIAALVYRVSTPVWSRPNLDIARSWLDSLELGEEEKRRILGAIKRWRDVVKMSAKNPDISLYHAFLKIMCEER